MSPRSRATEPCFQQVSRLQFSDRREQTPTCTARSSQSRRTTRTALHLPGMLALQAIGVGDCAAPAGSDLAGALGRPVQVDLQHIPDWRWMIGRTDYPWHPTMRLYRQAERGDWAEVFARVAGDLAVLARGQAAASV
jgi:hypothetical protein